MPPQNPFQPLTHPPVFPNPTALLAQPDLLQAHHRHHQTLPLPRLPPRLPARQQPPNTLDPRGNLLDNLRRVRLVRRELLHQRFRMHARVQELGVVVVQGGHREMHQSGRFPILHGRRQRGDERHGHYDAATRALPLEAAWLRGLADHLPDSIGTYVRF